MISLDTTTLVCLFHHRDRAQAALEDLLKAGVAESSVTLIGGDGSGIDALDKSELAELEMPDEDYDHLKQGIGAGGTVVAVQSVAEHVDTVEGIFKKHSAAKIDEADTERNGPTSPSGAYSSRDESLPEDDAPAPGYELSAAERKPFDETLLVSPTELTSEPFKSAGGIAYPGANSGSVRVYRLSAVTRSSPEDEADDLDRLPSEPRSTTSF